VWGGVRGEGGGHNPLAATLLSFSRPLAQQSVRSASPFAQQGQRGREREAREREGRDKYSTYKFCYSRGKRLLAAGEAWRGRRRIHGLADDWDSEDLNTALNEDAKLVEITFERRLQHTPD